MVDYIKIKNNNKDKDSINSFLNSAITETDPDNLLKLFTPIIYLHSQESYYPSSVDYVLKASTLKQLNEMKKPQVIKESPTQDYLFNEYCKDSQTTLHKDRFIDIPKSVIYGQKDDLSNVPVYGYVDQKNSKQGELHLVYVMFYPYNGEFKILGLEDKGTHFGDIEHITVVLKQNNNENAAKPVYKVDKLFFGAHGDLDGRWVSAEEAEWEINKDKYSPIIYAAYHSHATYPHAGTYFRIYGLANDNTDKGVKWDPKLEQVFTLDHPEFNPQTMGWVYFCGLWGDDGINSLAHKTFFNKGEPEKELLNPPRMINTQTWLFIKNFSIILLLTLILYGGMVLLKKDMKAFFILYVAVLASIPLITKYIIKKVPA